jgi:hypothetical protein
MKHIFLKALSLAIIFVNVAPSYAQLQRDVDQFTGKITLYTPLLKHMVLVKRIEGGKTFYDLSLRTCGPTLNVHKAGVTILFMDGSEMKKNEKIDVEAGDDENCDYKYSSFISLKPKELSALCSKNIKAFRLYVYDQNVGADEATKFIDNANLIVKSN